MIDVLLRIAITLGMKLVTEKVISRLVVIGLRECAKRTDNKWDDELVTVLEESLTDAKSETVSP